MKINYGINRVIRKGGKRRIVHENHQMVIDGRAGLRATLDTIRARHPGWAVTGYCTTPRTKRGEPPTNKQ